MMTTLKSMDNLLKKRISPIIRLLFQIGFGKMEKERIKNNPPKDVIIRREEYEKYWQLLDDITIELQFQDRHALAELAVMICEMNYLRQSIKDDGAAMKVQGDRNIVTKKNPALDAIEKLRPAILRLMKEFKMTPNSRGKTFGPSGGQAEDGFDDV